MKNTHIPNLHSEVPKDIRLEVYKEALRYYENKEYEDPANFFGLCLVLPCILWDDWTEKQPDGTYWDYLSSKKAFPELTDKVINNINATLRGGQDMKLRKKYLKQWIKELTPTL